MPIIKSAIKRMKQTAKRRERNVGIKRDIKGAVKTFMTNPTADSLSAAQSELDTAVKKGLLKKATVSRRKAGLAKIAKEAGVKMPTAKKAAAKSTSATPKKSTVKATKATTSKTAEKATTKAPAKKSTTKKAEPKK